jgi:hypothetical protein
VLFTSGQGAGHAAIVAFAPAWLHETEAHSGLQTGVGDWTFFGCKGVERVGHPSKVRVDGQSSGTLPLNHITAGANYLRMRLDCSEGPRGSSNRTRGRADRARKMTFDGWGHSMIVI